MQRIFERLKSETPIFFLKLRNICLALGAAAGATMLLPKYDSLPEWFHTGIGHCMVAGAIGAFISQLSKHEAPKE